MQRVHGRGCFGARTTFWNLFIRGRVRIVVFGDADYFRRATNFDRMFHRRDSYIDSRSAYQHANQSERPHGGDGGMYSGAALSFVSARDFDGGGFNCGGMG